MLQLWETDITSWEAIVGCTGSRILIMQHKIVPCSHWTFWKFFFCLFFFYCSRINQTGHHIMDKVEFVNRELFNLLIEKCEISYIINNTCLSAFFIFFFVFFVLIQWRTGSHIKTQQQQRFTSERAPEPTDGYSSESQRNQYFIKECNTEGNSRAKSIIF